MSKPFVRDKKRFPKTKKSLSAKPFQPSASQEYKPFRKYHLLQILSSFELQKLPLDLFLRFYFKKHTAVGSKDRKQICEQVYTLIRWRALLDYVAKPPLTWESRYLAFQKHSLS